VAGKCQRFVAPRSSTFVSRVEEITTQSFGAVAVSV
jgi:hypothetical protein